MSGHRWDDAYAAAELPWDTGRPSRHLRQVIAARAIAPGPALEIGCGTGTNAVWLAEQGFAVTAVDLSPRAVSIAHRKAEAAGVAVDLHVVDVLADPLPAGPYVMVFDRGCFHTFDLAVHRRRFARQVATVLAPGGVWLSLVGSTEGPPRDVGPPRRSAYDVVTAVEEWLEVVALESVTFDNDAPTAPRAWRCLFSRREVPAQPSTRRD
jgi:methyl halide transferase